MLKPFLSLAATVALGLALTSCGSSSAEAGKAEGAANTAAEKHYASTAELTDLDLSKYGYDVIVKAPKDARVLKDTVSHKLAINGGKYFKCSVSYDDGTFENPAALFAMKRVFEADKDLNPNFVKYVVDEPTALMSENKGTASNSFTVVLPTKTPSKFYTINDGIAYELNEDENTDFTPADVKTMFEAARMARLK